MNRSNLSRYVKLLRLRNGYSVDFTAHLLDISSVAYLRMEEAPEQAPAYFISRIMKNFSVNCQDWEDFQQLISDRFLGSVPAPDCAENPSNPPSNDGCEGENILSLDGQRSLPTKSTDSESEKGT